MPENFSFIVYDIHFDRINYDGFNYSSHQEARLNNFQD